MRLAVLLLAVLTAACAADQPATVDLPVPVEGSASEPRFAAAADGNLHLTWTEAVDGGHRVRFARFEGEGWGDPVTVAEGSDWFVNWADFPAAAVLADGTLAVHWLAKSAEGTYTYDVWVSVSPDGGTTWTDPVRAHDDGVAAEHGFVTLLPAGDRFFLAWLDGRNTGGGGHGETDGHGAGGAMTLRAGYLTRDGVMEDRTEIDARVCDCCNTAAALLDGEVVVAYRDRSEGEVRDISRVRFAGGAWSEPAPVHEDGWVIPGCPVNGPALAAHGDRVVCAWFTAPEVVEGEPDPACFAALSTDGGATFGDPVRLDGSVALGRCDAVALPDGEFVVGWLEEGGIEARFLVCRIGKNGARGVARELFRTVPSRSSGFPRLAVHDGRLFAAWTVPGDSASTVATRSFALP